ncbi:hypothetical protein D9M72_448660 [compost metagenome]
MQQGLVVGDQRGARGHGNGAAVLDELPAIDAAVRAKAVLQPGMRVQFARMARRAMAGKVIGRGGHHHAQRAGDRDRDHVALQGLAQAQPRVKAFGHQVGEAVVGDHVDGDAGAGAHEVGQQRPQHQRAGGGRGGQPQRAGGHVALLADIVGGGADLGQRRLHARQQRGPGFGQADAAGGPLQQPHAQARFQLANGLRDRRGADRQRSRGGGKAAEPRHARERGQRGQGIDIDCEVWLHAACSVARCFHAGRVPILAPSHAPPVPDRPTGAFDVRERHFHSIPPAGQDRSQRLSARPRLHGHERLLWRA